MKTLKLVFLTLLMGLLVILPVFSKEIKKSKSKKKEIKPSEVYFSKEISAEAAKKLYEKLNFKPGKKLGVKVHFGEKGNKNFLRSHYVKELIQTLKGTLVETNTLYGDNRSNSENHEKLAKEHGWDFAPIHILDRDGEIAVPYNGTFFKEVYVGKDMDKYDSYLVISHFKGHKMNGIGGALKNLAMGFGSPKGKKAQHFKEIPVVSREECVKCGLCVNTCPVKAIDEKINIDDSKCIGCGKCVTICPVQAMKSSSSFDKTGGFQKKVAEYADAMQKKYHLTYINFLNNISPSCDCMAGAEDPFVGDIGILSSNDPVALDQACYDLVNHKCKSKDAFKDHTTISGLPGLIHAEKLGAGTRKYKLIEIKTNIPKK